MPGTPTAPTVRSAITSRRSTSATSAGSTATPPTCGSTRRSSWPAATSSFSAASPPSSPWPTATSTKATCVSPPPCSTTPSSPTPATPPPSAGSGLHPPQPRRRERPAAADRCPGATHAGLRHRHLLINTAVPGGQYVLGGGGQRVLPKGPRCAIASPDRRRLRVGVAVAARQERHVHLRERE